MTKHASSYGKSGYGQPTGTAKRFMSDSGEPLYPMSGGSMKGYKTKKYPETMGRKYSKSSKMKIGSY